jgi:glycosyltransferase involved in cell wall biosynthesis
MQLEKPLISIVMAAYNEEKFIGEAIESILNQTYPHFEFIIINDGSTDKTEEIILSFSDPRIKYIKNEINLKLIASLNKGLSLATGKYIARMDSDDVSIPQRLEKQVHFMESNPEVGISGAQLIVFGSEDTTMNYPLEHEDIKLRLLITSCFPNNLVIFRRELMQQFKMSFTAGYHHAEDYKFWTQWVQVTKGANLPDYLVKYRFHASSVSHKYKDVQRQTRNRIRVEYLRSLFDLHGNESIATDLYGTNYNKKVKALKFILQRNQELGLFDQKKLTDTLFYLWYMDSLEQVEYDKSVVYNFPRIFMLSFKDNIKYWQNIFKHTIKSYLGLLPKTV